MSVKNLESAKTTRILVAAILGTILLAGTLMISSGSDARADSAVRAKKSKVLGAIGKLPNPLCPTNCEALAIVSGFQAEIDGVGTPYRVPYNGFITKWKIRLGSVTKSQRNFFEKRFGSKPKAGLSVITPVNVKGKRKYRLDKRSPIVGLNKYLGKVSSISLKKPIPVKKGSYVALTVPTWAPALAFVRPTPDFSWRASREKDTCKKNLNMKTSSPQKEPKSKRTYGCRFNGAQLLYRVKVVSNK